MLFFSELLFFCVIQSIYSKSHKHDRDNDSKEVNKLIGKIINSQRFNELADVIAERAILKLNDFQYPNWTKSSSNKDIENRSPQLRTHENITTKPKVPKNHKHGNIDIASVLIHKLIPVDEIRFRFKQLKQTNSNIARSNFKSSQGSQEEGTTNKSSQVSKEKDTTDKLFIINRENNKSHENDEGHSSISFENKEFDEIAVGLNLDSDNKVKTRSDEAFDNPFGNGQTISWGKKRTNSPSKMDLTNESTENEKQLSQEKKPKLHIRTEGDKQFVLEESPDYKEYQEEGAKMAKAKAV